MRAKVLSVLGVSALLLSGCTQAAPPPPEQTEAPAVISSASGGAGLSSVENITSSTSRIAVSAGCQGSGKLTLDFSTVGSMEIPCLEGGSAPRGQSYFDVSAVDGKFSVDIDAAEGQSWEFSIAESNKIP